MKGTHQGSTNSLMFLLAGTGFPTTILLLFMFYNQQIIKENKWLWMVIMFGSILSEPLFLRPLFFSFVISGFMYFFFKIISNKHTLT